LLLKRNKAGKVVIVLLCRINTSGTEVSIAYHSRGGKRVDKLMALLQFSLLLPTATITPKVRSTALL